jgi:hypothetical protein
MKYLLRREMRIAVEGFQANRHFHANRICFAVTCNRKFHQNICLVYSSALITPYNETSGLSQATDITNISPAQAAARVARKNYQQSITKDFLRRTHKNNLITHPLKTHQLRQIP